MYSKYKSLLRSRWLCSRYLRATLCFSGRPLLDIHLLRKQLPALCSLKQHRSCLEFELFLSARVDTASTCITSVTQILTVSIKLTKVYCSKLFHQRTVNQAINLSSFVFQLTRAERTAAHLCIKTPSSALPVQHWLRLYWCVDLD